ncbi:hypothetical protein XELAEV_18002862mg [Xenopus laevis]|uniref:Uncharacterized protein n=1 Tax=Xenopus laevis TaxID=8355 RepID=A0A974BQ74_XENLA|nr:hypothetical protein XELAEV_18002862mg [Xenopus laevis]
MTVPLLGSLIAQRYIPSLLLPAMFISSAGSGKIPQTLGSLRAHSAMLPARLLPPVCVMIISESCLCTRMGT